MSAQRGDRRHECYNCRGDGYIIDPSRASRVCESCLGNGVIDLSIALDTPASPDFNANYVIAMCSALVWLAYAGRVKFEGMSYLPKRGEPFVDISITVTTESVPDIEPHTDDTKALAFAERMMLFWSERAKAIGERIELSRTVK